MYSLKIVLSIRDINNYDSRTDYCSVECYKTNSFSSELPDLTKRIYYFMFEQLDLVLNEKDYDKNLIKKLVAHRASEYMNLFTFEKISSMLEEINKKIDELVIK